MRTVGQRDVKVHCERFSDLARIDARILQCRCCRLKVQISSLVLRVYDRDYELERTKRLVIIHI